MKLAIPILLFLCFCKFSSGQQLFLDWTKFIGSADSQITELWNAVPTRDGGVVFTGRAAASGTGDMPYNSFGGLFVGNLDSNLNIRWIHFYGGALGVSILQTSDGGFAILGYVEYNTGFVTGLKGNGDLWLLKIDSVGNYLWSKCFGSFNGAEFPINFCQVSDGGFILYGTSNGSDGDVPFHIGSSEFELDWFVVRTDSNGNKLWSKDLGGLGFDGFSSKGGIFEADKGFLLVSNSTSTDHDCTDTAWHAGLNTYDDLYVLKLDSTGNVMWNKSFGGSSYDEIYSAAWDNRDSSILLGGVTSSNDYIFSHPLGTAFIIKVDKNGTLKWAHTYLENQINSIALTDSGYLTFGESQCCIFLHDLSIAKIDMNGNVMADTVFGGTGYDYSYSAFPFKSGFLASGSTNSQGFANAINYGTIAFGERCFFSFLSDAPSPVSVNIISPEFEFEVFPNPARNELNIVGLKKRTSYRLISTTGICVQQGMLEQGTSLISTKNFASGIYILEMTGSEGKRNIVRVVKE